MNIENGFNLPISKNNIAQEQIKLDHSKLKNRNLENQHSISSITNLEKMLHNLQGLNNINFNFNNLEDLQKTDEGISNVLYITKNARCYIYQNEDFKELFNFINNYIVDITPSKENNKIIVTYANKEQKILKLKNEENIYNANIQPGHILIESIPYGEKPEAILSLDENVLSFKFKIPNPKNGTDGKSAYELAIELGFDGSLNEWMDSLKSFDRKSTYEIAIDNGFSGTEEEWTNQTNINSVYPTNIETLNKISEYNGKLIFNGEDVGYNTYLQKFIHIDAINETYPKQIHISDYNHFDVFIIDHNDTQVHFFKKSNVSTLYQMGKDLKVYRFEFDKVNKNILIDLIPSKSNKSNIVSIEIETKDWAYENGEYIVGIKTDFQDSSESC